MNSTISLTSWRKLDASYFAADSQTLANKLLGKILVRRTPDTDCLLWGRIVETEAYLGETDQAAHTYKLRQTTRNAAMFMKPGTAYVYFTYGMYYCFNISSAGAGAGVLLRAVEPIGGLETMQKLRQNRLKKTDIARPILASHNLANGPAKLCLAFDIDKRFDQHSLDTSDWLWVAEDDFCHDGAVVTSSRIGINAKYGEWARKPLRYYLASSSSVSVRDRSAEVALSITRPLLISKRLETGEERPAMRTSRKRKQNNVT